jgi:hypothetical protein
MRELPRLADIAGPLWPELVPGTIFHPSNAAVRKQTQGVLRVHASSIAQEQHESHSRS